MPDSKSKLVIPGRATEGSEGKGTQEGNTATVFPSWAPFPSLRSAGDDNRKNTFCIDIKYLIQN